MAEPIEPYVGMNLTVVEVFDNCLKVLDEATGEIIDIEATHGVWGIGMITLLPGETNGS